MSITEEFDRELARCDREPEVVVSYAEVLKALDAEIVRLVHMKALVEALDRCDREIREMTHQPPVKPAYITTLGIEDWRCERRLIENELRKPEGGAN